MRKNIGEGPNETGMFDVLTWERKFHKPSLFDIKQNRMDNWRKIMKHIRWQTYTEWRGWGCSCKLKITKSKIDWKEEKKIVDGQYINIKWHKTSASMFNEPWNITCIYLTLEATNFILFLSLVFVMMDIFFSFLLFLFIALNEC